MSEALAKYLIELTEFLVGHQHYTAAGELADLLDQEDTTT